MRYYSAMHHCLLRRDRLFKGWTPRRTVGSVHWVLLRDSQFLILPGIFSLKRFERAVVAFGLYNHLGGLTAFHRCSVCVADVDVGLSQLAADFPQRARRVDQFH